MVLTELLKEQLLKQIAWLVLLVCIALKDTQFHLCAQSVVLVQVEVQYLHALPALLAINVLIRACQHL